MDIKFNNVRTNIVQSIRAYTVKDLQTAAEQLGHKFLYVNLSKAQNKQEVLDLIAAQYTLPAHFGKNFDALYDCMTDLVQKSDEPPGFIVVLDQIPTHSKFDKETREQLLDIFRDTSDYWGERKIPFRCFYSFSLARTPKAEEPPEIEGEEALTTHKLRDVSPTALRMSSPFNAQYWQEASAL